MIYNQDRFQAVPVQRTLYDLFVHVSAIHALLGNQGLGSLKIKNQANLSPEPLGAQHTESLGYFFQDTELSFTSEKAAAVFPSGFCDRGVLPSNDNSFSIE